MIERPNGGQTGEMDGDDQKRRPGIKRGKLDVHTLEVQTNKGMVTVGDEPNFWEGKLDLRGATKPVGEPRLCESTKERASPPRFATQISLLGVHSS
jgi:hypothetical protein